MKTLSSGLPSAGEKRSLRDVWEWGCYSFPQCHLAKGMEVNINSGQEILFRNFLRSLQGFCLSVLKHFYSWASLPSVSHLFYEVNQMISFFFFFLLFFPNLNIQLVKTVYVHTTKCFAIHLQGNENQSVKFYPLAFQWASNLNQEKQNLLLFISLVCRESDGSDVEARLGRTAPGITGTLMGFTGGCVSDQLGNCYLYFSLPAQGHRKMSCVGRWILYHWATREAQST